MIQDQKLREILERLHVEIRELSPTSRDEVYSQAIADINGLWEERGCVTRHESGFSFDVSHDLLNSVDDSEIIRLYARSNPDD